MKKIITKKLNIKKITLSTLTPRDEDALKGGKTKRCSTVSPCPGNNDSKDCG